MWNVEEKNGARASNILAVQNDGIFVFGTREPTRLKAEATTTRLKMCLSRRQAGDKIEES